MKKIEIKEFGGPEVLEIKNVDIGKPGQNEVLVKNLSIGINYIDEDFFDNFRWNKTPNELRFSY